MISERFNQLRCSHVQHRNRTNLCTIVTTGKTKQLFHEITLIQIRKANFFLHQPKKSLESFKEIRVHRNPHTQYLILVVTAATAYSDFTNYTT